MTPATHFITGPVRRLVAHAIERRSQWIGVLILLFVSLSASAVTSIFSADKVAGCAPLVVNFTPNDAPCSGCTYSWNFGTGSPVTGYTASSSFLTAGVHVVTLTVTSGALSSSSTRTITVYANPTVNFTTSDTAICPGKTVTFSNTSTNGASGPATIKWTLGDGDTALVSPVTHTYMLPGYYNVALSVTNSNGCTTTLTKTTLIHVYTPPAVSFTQNKTTLCDPPAPVAFTNTSTGSAPLSYLWRFGDNTTSTATSPSHNYSTNGTYSVLLKVTDVHGCPDSAIGGTVTVGSVTSGFTFNDTACVNAPVSFTNTSSAHTYRQWLFGDGASATTVDAEHTYSVAGTYQVKLITGFSPCIDTLTQVMHVIPGPAGSFTTTPAQPCASPVSVTFTSTAPPGTNVTWWFENAYLRTGSPYIHTFAADSIVDIMMIKVHPVYGCRDTIKVKDTLYDHVFDISVDRDRGCVPLTVNFATTNFTTKPTGLVSPYPYGVDSIKWTLGIPGATAAGATTSYTYNDTGIYRIYATMYTSNNCVVKDSIDILVGNVPAATFTAAPLHACREDTITFTASVTSGVVDSFVWDFGDFLTFTDTVIKKRPYTLPGEFTVTLTPCFYGCCGDTFIRRDYVLIDSPKAVLYYKFNCPIDRQVLFFDSSLGNDVRTWYFGDGDSSSAAYPAHTYASKGQYPIELVARNTVAGCVDRRRDTITVVDPHPDFTAFTTTQLCEPDTVVLQALDTTGARLSFKWIIESTSTPYSNERIYKHGFSLPGRYDVTMVSWDDNNCLDTVRKPNYVVLGKPIAGFKPSAPQGCVPFSVTFTDTSKQVIGLTASTYRWNFGDGDTASTTSATFNHTYTAVGTYTVTEIVTNNINCSDTITGVITVLNANPNFNASLTHPCVGVPVSFNNTTLDLVTCKWQFGDGDTSLLTTPTHAYNDTGRYNVSLTVTDSHGCTATTTFINYITTTKPIARFTVVDSVSVCVPFLAQFYNGSTGAATYSWKFGDGHESVVPSPTNNYTVAGIYTAQLIVTNPWGCKDTATRTMKAYGYPGGFTYTPKTGCSPMNVHFTSSLEKVPSITWDFADGIIVTTSGSDTISHVYTTPGAYVPKLILSDNAGCVASNIGTDTIKVSAVVAKLVTSPDTICPGVYFSLIDSSKTYFSPIVSRTWVYDALTSTTPSPMHMFSSPGTYAIHLESRNGWGCVGVKDTDIIVPFIAPITGDSILCTGTTTTFASATSGGIWNSSDALKLSFTSVSGLANALAAGTATISYKALGCQVERTVTVQNTPPAIAGTYTVCVGATTVLSNTLAGGSWISGNTAVATINSLGTVTGVNAGTVTITYKAGICFSTVTVTVFAMPATIGGDKDICSASSTLLSNSLGGGIWSSSDTTIVKVDNTGTATGIVVGTATITYNVNGCIATTTVTVNNSIPPISGQLTVCVGNSTTLSNAGAGGTWISGDTAVATITPAAGILSGKQVGTCLITYSLGGGCRDTAVVNVIPPPDPGTLSGPDAVCIGDSVVITPSIPGGTWSASGTGISVIAGNVRGISTGSDTVIYTITAAFCASKTKTPIYVNPLPDAGIITNTGPYCANATAVLSTQPVNTGGWYSLNSSIVTIDSASGTATTIAPGKATIVFTAIDTNGCKNITSAEMEVIVPNFTLYESINDVSCWGDSNGSITLTVTGAPTFEYLWSNGKTTPLVTGLPQGTYSVLATQQPTQCKKTGSYLVAMPDSLWVDATAIPDTCALARGMITALPYGGAPPYNYIWTKGSAKYPDLSVLTGATKGVYLLTLKDAKGCIDTISVNVEEGPCNAVEIYDVITPNGDGVNDFWVINGIKDYPHNTVQIFDKWGDLVYEKQGYNNEWQGQGNKGELPDGTYYYLVKLNEPNKFGGPADYAGAILLKR